MANFSNKKNASKPPNRQANSERGSVPDSNASGSACNSEVDSMMPTDRLTMRSTILDNKVNEKIAAAVMLSAPAIAVANRMDNNVE